MVPSNPQHEISNQLKARCCGRVAQYEPRIASEYIYIYYTVYQSIYLSVCFFVCLFVCLFLSMPLMYFMSTCMDLYASVVCAYVSVVFYAPNLEYVRVIQYPVSCPCSGNTFFFGRMKRKTKYKSQLIRFSCWHARWSMVWPARFCVQLEEMNPKPNGQTDQMKHWWKTWDINIFVFAACWCFPVRGMDP